MELERGQCSFCSNINKILIHKNPGACEKLFIHLFGDIEKIREKLLLLKWCPMCYQKMFFLLNNLPNLEDLKSGGDDEFDDDECIICRKDINLVKIKTWTYWKQILEELVYRDVDLICLDCLYILDIRHTFKQKICTRYPQLRKPQERPQTKHTRPKRNTNADIIEISDDENTISSDSKSIFERIKPLKHDKHYRSMEAISDDPKFFSQVPYARLQLYSPQSSPQQHSKKVKEEHKKNAFFKIKFKSHNNCYSIVKPNIKKRKTKSLSYLEKAELKKHNMNDTLVINITKLADELIERLKEELSDDENVYGISLRNIEEYDSQDNDLTDTEGSNSSDLNIDESAIEKRKQKLESEDENDEEKPEDNESSEVADETSRNTESKQKTEENEVINTEENLDSLDDQHRNETNLTVEETPKKRKPKPLSKQKKEHILKKADPEEDNDQQENESNVTVEETPKKRKPKPLSKQKRDDKETVEGASSEEELENDTRKRKPTPYSKQRENVEEDQGSENETPKSRKSMQTREHDSETNEDANSEKEEDQESEVNVISKEMPRRRESILIDEHDDKTSEEVNSEKEEDQQSEVNVISNETPKTKKRKRDDEESVDGSNSEKDQESGDNEMPRKRKPKPLSKQKQNNEPNEQQTDQENEEENNSNGSPKTKIKLTLLSKNKNNENIVEVGTSKTDEEQEADNEETGEDSDGNRVEKESTKKADNVCNDEKETEGSSTSESTENLSENEENKKNETDDPNQDDLKNEKSESDKQEKLIETEDIENNDKNDEKLNISKSVSGTDDVNTSEEDKQNGLIDDFPINLDDFEEIDSSENDLPSTKRKQEVESAENVFSPDKKKKRVTFSDEVIESLYD